MKTGEGFGYTVHGCIFKFRPNVTPSMFAQHPHSRVPQPKAPHPGRRKAAHTHTHTHTHTHAHTHTCPHLHEAVGRPHQQEVGRPRVVRRRGGLEHVCVHTQHRQPGRQRRVEGRVLRAWRGSGGWGCGRWVGGWEWAVGGVAGGWVGVGGGACKGWGYDQAQRVGGCFNRRWCVWTR